MHLLKKILARRQRGFVLIFALVFLSLALVIAATQAGALLEEFRAVAREGHSLQALSAADTAVACARFFHGGQSAFDTRGPATTYDCGVGTFTGGGVNEGEEECVEHTYEFRLEDFSNGACVDMSVTTVPTTFWAGSTLVSVCDVQVEARGYNSCAVGASRVVERVRTANF